MTIAANSALILTDITLTHSNFSSRKLMTTLTACLDLVRVKKLYMMLK